MHIEMFREYCLGMKDVTEDFPFGESTMVFKVHGKMFALAGLDDVPGSCNLKCDPDYAEELREKNPAITPGYHMNKKHWNTIEWDGSISDSMIFGLVDHSYNLVKESLPKELRRSEKQKQKAKSQKPKIKQAGERKK